MPNFHVITNNAVTNTIVAADLATAEALNPGATVIAAASGGIGWTWDGTTLHAPASAAKPMPTPRAWLERLSDSKQQAITTAAASNPAIMLWLLKAAGTTAIDVTLPETQTGVAALVTAGVLTNDDAAVLLAP